jgi:hypothetical protein
MIDEENVLEQFDWNLANAYMDKAVQEGRAEDEGFEDYLGTLGFTRTKDIDAFLQKFREEDRKSTERIMGYLEEIKRLARAAQKKYTGA